MIRTELKVNKMYNTKINQINNLRKKDEDTWKVVQF
jgi:hypothetical protein